MSFVIKRPAIYQPELDNGLSTAKLFVKPRDILDLPDDLVLQPFASEIHYGLSHRFLGTAVHSDTMPFSLKKIAFKLVDDVCEVDISQLDPTQTRISKLIYELQTKLSASLRHQPMYLSGGSGIKHPITRGGDLYLHVLSLEGPGNGLTTMSIGIGTVTNWSE